MLELEQTHNRIEHTRIPILKPKEREREIEDRESASKFAIYDFHTYKYIFLSVWILSNRNRFVYSRNQFESLSFLSSEYIWMVTVKYSE